MKFTKILVKYVVRYFTGFLIVFMCSVLVAAVASQSIEKYIIERSEMKNQEGINSICEMVSKMDLINQMMVKNQTFTTIVYQRGKIPEKDILKLKDANRMFNEIGFVADYTPYVFMLFQNNDLYLSTNQCSFEFQGYYNKFLTIEKEGLDLSTADRLKEELFDRYARRDRFMKVDTIHYIYNEKEQTLENPILYLVNSESVRSNSMYLSCFVIDRRSIIGKIMLPEFEEQGFLYIEDLKSNDVLLRYGSVPKSVSNCVNGQIIGEDENYRVIVNEQKDLQWKIVTGIPMAFIDEQSRSVSHLLAVYLWIGLLFVIGLTVYFSFKRYSGIRKVLFALPLEGGEALGKKGLDEYGLVTENILQLKEKGEDYRERVEELSKQNEAILLEHLLVMGIRTPQERKVFEKCFENEPEFFCVSVVRSFHKDYKKSEFMTLFMVEYFKKYYKGNFTNVYSGITDELFLFELKHDQESNVSAIKKLFEEITTILSEEYDAVFHVGISAIGTDISNISKCYEQALSIVQAQFAYGDENVVKLYDISANALYENPVNLEFLNRFHNLLICSQEEEALSSIDRLESHYSRMPYLYEIQKEQIFYSIRNIIYTAWLHLGGEKDFKGGIPEYSSTLTCREMMDMFRESARLLCGYIEQTKKSKNEDLKEKVLSYLKSHYQEAGLSAYEVSHAIGISEKYLSQFVKEQTGETFSAYLLKLRIERAKELLETMDYSNDKIADMTGFGAVNTFYRNFNRYVGVTPKVYKENCEKH